MTPRMEQFQLIKGHMRCYRPMLTVTVSDHYFLTLRILKS